MKPTVISVQPTRVGWARVRTGEGEAMVLFAFAADDTLVVDQYVACRVEPLRLPFVLLERWANGPTGEGLRLAVKERAVLNAADLDAADLYEYRDAKRRHAWGAGAEALTSQAILMAGLHPLMIPDTKVKADDFYEAVADQYDRAVACATTPAQVLAQVNGVPAATIWAWLKEARRRGLMAPGSRT